MQQLPLEERRLVFCHGKADPEHSIYNPERQATFGWVSLVRKGYATCLAAY
jgi:hypothetical protein